MTEKKILTPEEIEVLKKRHIRSFTLRRGHISQAQKRSLEELVPRYALNYEEKIISPESIFGRKAPLVLEIGCGMGETLPPLHKLTLRSISLVAKSSPQALVP